MERTTFTEKEAVCILYDALKALEALHLQKRVHTKLCPSDILVDVSGCCKLEFGRLETLLIDGTLYGHPQFIAPEATAGGKNTAKADVWALGITVVALLEGAECLPFSDVHPMRAIRLAAESPSPTLVNKERFSTEVNDFLAACLQKNPANRPTASALLKHPLFENYDDSNRSAIRDLVEKAKNSRRYPYTS